MSKFDKYGVGDKPLLPSGGSGASRLPTDRRVASEIAKAQRAISDPGEANRLVFGSTANVAIALDATGSMAGLLEDTKASIAEIITRASREAGRPIEIELLVYRDYDVPGQIIERSGRASDPAQLLRWLARIQPLGGGGNEGEAIEVALERIVDDGNFGVVLLAGDEPANGKATLSRVPQAQSAHDLARTLGQKGVPIHTFVVGNDPRTVDDFQRLAEASGGRSGRMDGSRDMIDLAVLAILAKLKGNAGVKKYMDTARLTENSKAFGQLLLGKSHG